MSPAPRRSSSALALAAAVLSLACPAVAVANGRFPQAQQLVVDPTNPAHITVQTTYGFIDTPNGGKDWRWICEDAAGYGGVLDPPLTILGDGTLIAGVFNGLSVSTNQGCDFSFAMASAPATCQSTLTNLDGRFVVDVAQKPGDPSSAIAITSNGCGGQLFDTRVWTSTDNGKTWATAGVPLPQAFLALTVDIAPTATGAPGEYYASGFRVVSATDYRGALVHTVDGGATWQSVDIAGSNNLTPPYIAAIDPNDHKTVYVRFSSDQGALLVTHDSGTTFTNVLNAQGQLMAFALSPDGKTILTGGPIDGVLRASVADFKFTPVSPIHARCLTWSGSTVYACASEASDGFTIGKSADQGATFTPIHHLSCLEGPVGCAASSAVATKCAGPWATVASTIQTDTCTSSYAASSSSSSSGGNAMVKGGCATAPGGTDDAALVPLLAIGAALLTRRSRRA